MSARVIQGMANAGRPCGREPRTDTPARSGKVQHADDDGRADHGDQDARHALVALEQQDHRQVPCADRERGPVGLSIHDRFGDGPQIFSGPAALDRKTEKLGQLADQYRQRDPVHVTVADRLGKQLGDEAQARYAGQDAHRPRHDRHHACKNYCSLRIAVGQRQDYGQDDGSQGGVGTQNENSAGPEQGIRQ